MFVCQRQKMVAAGMAAAQNRALIQSGFFSNFSLDFPTADQTGWTENKPQDFIVAAQTLEPLSLMLLGSRLWVWQESCAVNWLANFYEKDNESG